MSLGGVRSNRGDRYQRSLALNWIVKMLVDQSIEGVLVEAVAVPNELQRVYGDDLVIYQHSRKSFVQAKVNQSSHHSWRLSDKTLKKELGAAYKQLKNDPSCDFHFYYRTPFVSRYYWPIYEKNTNHSSKS